MDMRGKWREGHGKGRRRNKGKEGRERKGIAARDASVKNNLAKGRITILSSLETTNALKTRHWPFYVYLAAIGNAISHQWHGILCTHKRICTNRHETLATFNVLIEV